jgi:hypothetical protein
MTRGAGWVFLLACGCGVEAATFSPASTTNDLNNPHKGFMLWGTDYADGAPNNFYGATIYHVYAPWREIETADQVFDWGRFETNHLLPILDDHPDATFVVRPVADYPDGQNSGITLFYTGGELTRDFPAFLTNAPLSIPAYPYTSCDGDGPGITPDWNRPAMLTQLVQFVQAFGARYDGDPRITAVQVGLLGLWGEWHQSGCDTRAPSNAVKVAVRDAYVAAFTNTPLQTRYARDPDSMGVSFGFHEDYFPSFTAPCIYGFPSCSDDGDWSLHFGFQNVNPAAATNWRVNPISGESPNNAQKRAWTNDTDDVMTVLRDYHFSFLGPAGGHEANGRQARLNPMKRLLGYNYHLLRVDWPETAALGATIPVTLALTNSGAAPCYHPFRVELALCAADGTPHWRVALTNDLRALVPGWHAEWTATLLPTGLTAGTYSLRVGIRDPRTGEPGVRIQSVGEDVHQRIVVGDIVIQDLWAMDSDGDGLPDGWELAYFGHPTNALAGVDDDGDGQSNLDHYISGTDPTNRFSFFAITDAHPGEASGVRVQSVTNRRYRLWRTTELLAGAWAELPVDLPGNGLPLDLVDTNPPVGAFYRAAVELAP